LFRCKREVFLLFQEEVGRLISARGAALAGREKFNPCDETEILGGWATEFVWFNYEAQILEKLY